MQIVRIRIKKMLQAVKTLNWRAFVLFSLIFFLFSGLSAQVFPVQIIPQVTPPPPIYLSNYADASTINSPLRVQLILNDFNIQSRAIRLKTYFQGSGLNFQSTDLVTGATPLFLEAGVPLILTNAELAPYFRFENIAGISPNVYGNAIPEGTYQFCFEVFDVATGNRLSSKTCVTTVIFKNEPPFLVTPRNRSNVAEINPQYIVFQWTPRSINVTNVEYELSLVEIWDTQIDPQAAFLSSPPIYQTTTNTTTYVYGPSDPLLLSGKNYAWRIQAKAKQGTEEIGLFKNEGYSEIYSFSYATACDLPEGISHEVKGSTITNIFWEDFSNDVPEYTIRYRKKSLEEGEWFMNKTTGNSTSLWGLAAGTTYEYQIQKKCAVTKSDWSIAKQFTTHIADNEASVYECGITPDFSLSNTEKLASLTKGDTFTAGDFPVKVLTTSGTNGRFTGTGYVTIPYLNSIRVSVKFTNVLINTDKQLAEGTVVTYYDENLSNILDIDDAIETVGNIGEAVGELFEGNNDLDEIRINWVLDPKEDIEIKDGILVITNPANGATETSPLGDDKVIVDAAGNVYHVDAGGNITKGGQIDPSGSVTTGNVTGVSKQGELEALTAEGIQVRFEDQDTYGYDQMPSTANDKLKKEYTTIPDVTGQEYTLAHVAVEKGDSISVTSKVAIATTSAYRLADLKFKTKAGELIPSEINESNNTIDLSIKGYYTLESETIYAVVNSKQDSTQQLTAGAFTLWHLTDRTVNVVLVSVDNAPLPNIRAIENIFKKGIVSLTIETAAAELDDSTLGLDKRLEIGDSPWLTAYNTEQKEVIAHLKSQIDYDKSKYYVFVFPKTFETTKAIAGFMPLQRQFGFVFSADLNAGEEGKNSIEGATAHELGHGIFALQHPFTQYGTTEGSTEWLMDYGEGIKLPHTHWAQMHNPALKFYVFQDEEDGEIAGRNWFTPNWRPFSIENSITIRAKEDANRVKGTIPGFRLSNGIAYDAEYEANGSFKGYFTKGNKNPYALKLITNIKSTTSVYLYEHIPNECANTYLTDYDYVNNNKNNLDFSSNNKNIIPVDITTNCDKELCEEGQQYFDSYKDLLTVEGDEEDYLKEVAKIICAEQSTEITEAYKSLYNEWKDTPKSIGRNQVLEFSWKKYFQALSTLVSWRENGITDLLKNSSLEKSELRDKLFDIALKVNTEVLALIPLDQKVEMLTTMLDGNIYNLFTTNHDVLIAKVISSISDDEASDFLDILILPSYKNSKGEPLIYVLKENLSDFFNSQNPYTEFFKEIKRLSDAKNKLSDGNLDVKATLKWDVEQKDYVLFSYVKNKNDYVFNYDDSTHTVSISTCVSCCVSSPKLKCQPKNDYLLPQGSSPFDLVGLIIINDVSPFGANCVDGQTLNENSFCGKEQIVPALFLDYLKTNEQNQRLENFGWNTFNVVITISTFGEGAAAIGAIRTASSGQKLITAGKNAYALLDFTYTVTDLGFKAADAEMPAAWTWVGYAFAAKGGYDLIKNGGAKGIGYLKKLIREGKDAEVKNIIQELGVTNKNGDPLTLDDVKSFVDNTEIEINSGKNPEIKAEFNKGLNASSDSSDWTTVIGKSLTEVSDAPFGYKFYSRNGKIWIRRLSADNPNTPRLTVRDGKIVKYFHDGQIAFKAGWSKSKVLSYSKSSRPSPETYLEPSYMQSHLAKFNNGASYLVPKSSLDNYGRNPVGRLDGQFVMTKMEMDNLLNEADGNLSIIKEELGIPNKYWNEEIVRIDIMIPNSLNPRIPTGKEKGANELWLPGGLLPNGYSEIVLDAIPSGSFYETITNIK